MSESNRIKVYYVKETNYGVTPVDATWKTLRYTSESLTSSHTNTSSQEVRSDRQTADSVRVSSEAAGDLSIEFSALSFDDLLEASMASTWEVDAGVSTLKVGTERPSFSIEKVFEDVDRYFAFSGMRAGTMSLNVNYGEILQGSFSFMGNGATASTTSLVGTGGSITPAPSTDVMNATTDLTTLNINGAPSTVCVQSLTLNLDNSLRNRNCIGSVYAKGIMYGTVAITGSMQVYFSADAFAMYQNVLDNADISFSFAVTDGITQYTFTIPRAKVTGDAPTGTGLDSDVELSLEFTALLDPTTETSLLIEKETL